MCDDLNQLFTRRASDLERSDKLLFSLVQFGRYPNEVRKYVLKIWDNGSAVSSTKGHLENLMLKDDLFFRITSPYYIPAPVNDEYVWVHGERYVGAFAQLQCLDKFNLEWETDRERINKGKYLVYVLHSWWNDFQPYMTANATKMWFYDTKREKEW